MKAWLHIVLHQLFVGQRFLLQQGNDLNHISNLSIWGLLNNLVDLKTISAVERPGGIRSGCSWTLPWGDVSSTEQRPWGKCRTCWKDYSLISTDRYGSVRSRMVQAIEMSFSTQSWTVMAHAGEWSSFFPHLKFCWWRRRIKPLSWRFLLS